MADITEPRPSWKVRRRIVIATLLFCAGAIVYLLVFGKDMELHETIASGILILAGSTIGGYIFGAAWDDKNVMQALKPGRRRTAIVQETVEPLPVDVDDESNMGDPPKGFAG